MLATGTRTRNGSYNTWTPVGTDPRFDASDPGLKKRVRSATAIFGTANPDTDQTVVQMHGLLAAGFKAGDLVVFSGTNKNNGMFKVAEDAHAADGETTFDDWMSIAAVWPAESTGFKPETATNASVRTV